MKSEELHGLALRLHEAGHHDEALKLLRELLANTESSEIWSDWATIQFRRGDAAEAEAGYRMALQLRPEDTQVAANLGALLIEQGRAAEAVPFLQRGLTSENAAERAATEQLSVYAIQRLENKPYENEPAMEQFLREYVGEDPNEKSYFETHFRRFVATLLMLPHGSGKERILEIGPAFHHVTPALKHCKGYTEVRCMDVWKGAAQRTLELRARSGRFNDEVVEDNWDVQAQPWPYKDGEFDAVMCCEVLEHLWADPMGMFAEMNRVLKLNGLLLLTTPNLASGHAVEETMRGASPYTYGKFELGSLPTDRHNREYAAAEVERLAGCAGFTLERLRTQDFYWPPKAQTLRQLAAQGFPLGRRGDTTFLVARKQGAVQERYPEEFYLSNGLQSQRRETDALPASTKTSAKESAPVAQNVLLVHEIVPHYDCSGADLRIFELVRELRHEGCNVTFLARQERNEEKYTKALEALGAKVVAGDYDRLKHVGEDRPTAWKLQEILTQGQFDVAILCHWYWNAISLAEHYLDDIRQWSPQTCVMVLSEDRHGERERRSYRLTKHLSDLERGEELEQREAEVYERADLVLYVSEVDHRHFQTLLPKLRAEHLPTLAESGTTGPEFSKRDGVLFLGNFENLANRDGLKWMLEEVMPRLQKAEPDLKLYVAGNALTTDICPPKPNVLPLGKVGDLAPVFAERRVFVGPVRYGTGIITKNMIAMVHGLPVVTTPIGGEGLQLVDGEHALIAEEPEAFAAAILRLYRQEELWNSISTHGREYIRANFNQERVREQLRKILAMAGGLPRKAHDPAHEWSYRRVENHIPEVLTQQPARYRPELRVLGYWQLGLALLHQGKQLAALTQFRHIFATLRGEIPPTLLHIRLLEDMARCYDALGKPDAAARCQAEVKKLSKGLPHYELSSARGERGKKAASEATPEISVIAPTYDRRKTLQLCLTALSFQTLPAQYWELIVVDDGSTDGTEKYCRSHSFPFAPLRYVRQKNQGAGAARRAGVEVARGNLLVFLNDDTLATPTLLAEHLAVHKRNPREKWALLGSFQATEDCDRHALSLWIQRSTFLFAQNGLRPGQVCDAAFFVTCNLSVPRKAVLEAGSFDAAFRLGEDTELGLRLAAKGYRVKYHPQAVAWHAHPSFNTGDLLRRAEAYGPVHVTLFQKHPELVKAGKSRFGKLEAEDFRRMEAFVREKQAAVTESIVALEALDGIDLFELLRMKQIDKMQINGLLQKVSQLVPMVYWHRLFESFLKASRAAEKKAEAVVETVGAGRR